ncbi:hypothetical protein HAHE_28760 [Haloferula helveola]|uniref:PEP-CTERM protein-sorting domain-containing protein n=1 Tax=Haloferula helveola TaxID=490095 RepID=A0ABM7RBK1_9BACT|nr:hypothetical protein HAHE_28760 [Haloferula helveola]
MKSSLLAACLLVPSLHAVTVVNGSFENLTSAYVDIPGADRDGNAAADGWTISAESPDWFWGEGPEGLWETNWGDYFMNGASTGPTYREGFSQTISGFTIGATYTLNFSHANGLFFNPGTPGFYEGVNVPGGWEVLLNGSSLYLADSVNSNAVAAPDHTTDWFTRNIDFVATAETIEIEFLAYKNPQVGGQDPTFQFLDNVSITTVPEPGCAVLCVAGLLLSVRRRRTGVISPH